jgi:hypothetical protein
MLFNKWAWTMKKLKKWTVQDRYGNEIYLTAERWHHILEARPEKVKK